MVKDLRTNSVPLKLHKYSKLDGTAWGLQNIQPFFPPLEKLFKTENLSSVHDYGVRLKEEVGNILDADTIRTSRGKVVKVHRKTTSILNHFRWMRGDYGGIGLPNPSSVDEEIHERTQSPHNAGYVGAMTSIVLSESECRHFPEVYGVFVGIASKHTIDISDDYEDLSEKHWFAENVGKTFELKLKSHESESSFKHTRGNRMDIELGDDMKLDGIEDISAEHIDEPDNLASISCDYEEMGTSGGSTSHPEEEQDSPWDTFDIESCDCEDEEDEEEEIEEEDAEEDDSFAWATFSNIPVITTVMEKCDGTIYDLFMQNPDPIKQTAWISQAVFALAYAQRNFGLTHNDLHCNNIMYVPTTEEYFYYRVDGVSYKVPTYGYLIKIIDFDRAILSVRLHGMKESRTFMSNQFHIDEEAGGQYNVEPFFLQEVPYIPPNPSFDLARFATSIFWDIFPEGPEHSYTHPLFTVFKEWMMQTDGTSVLFRKQMDDHDRYHGFHLYKAIARYCRNAVPKKEIKRLTFYATSSIPSGTAFLDIN
jgi:hypothetical protein